MGKNLIKESGSRAVAWLRGVLALCVAALALTACDGDDEKRIGLEGLPNNAQVFIETYFNGVEVSSVIREKDDGRTTYDVLLADGTDIEFDNNGDWTSIDCFFSPLPSGILLAAITDKVEELHPGATIHGVDKEVGGYAVEVLDNGVEWDMYFNLQGDFGREVQDRG